MFTIYQLKPAFQHILRPLMRQLAAYQVTPNHITLLALFISLFMGLILTFFSHAQWAWLLLPIVLFIRMILNAIDGMLAREYQMQTPIGVFLNEIGDVLSDAFLYLPFLCVPGVSTFLVIFTVLFAMISEMTGVVAIQIGATRRYDGPMGKSDRAFVFGMMGLLLGLGINAWLWVNIVLSAMLLLLILTILNRIRQALRETHDA